MGKRTADDRSVLSDRVSGTDSGSTRGAFLRGLARGFGGSIIFALPMLMTMEMWWLGFYMDRFRMALLMLLMIPILIILSHYSGFRKTETWKDDVADGAVAYGIAFFASLVLLSVFNVVNVSMSVDEILGKVSLQAVPASFGAVLSESQFGTGKNDIESEEKKERMGYGGELFLMMAGAIFLAFNVAPTEEMILIAYMLSEAHAILLVLLSLMLIHAFVYASNFRGSHEIPEGTPRWSMFMRFSIVGYAISLCVSAYVLWTFGRFDQQSVSMGITMAVVLGFPASIGAAAARLIL